MQLKKLFILLAGVATFTATAVTPRLENNVDMSECQRWVDSVYNSMTERQRVGQLVFPKVVTTQGANTKATLKNLIDNGAVGGIIFTEGSIEQ